MLITHQSCWGCGLSWIHFISCGANSACFARVSRGKPILRYIMSKFLKQKRWEKKENSSQRCFNIRFCTCSNSIQFFFSLIPSYFFLSWWAGGILQILQSDWFWEQAVFSPFGPLTAGGIRKNVSKFSWKPF